MTDRNWERLTVAAGIARTLLELTGLAALAYATFAIIKFYYSLTA